MVKLSKLRDLVIIMAAVCKPASQQFIAQAIYPQSRFVPRPPSSTRFAKSQPIGYRAALNYLYGEINYEKLGLSGAAQYPFRLERMAVLFETLGLEHLLDASISTQSSANSPIPLIHLAGTKGKGSTASLIASACTESGYRTGLYTSPHLTHLEERFQIDGEKCQQSHFVDLVKEIRAAAERIEPKHGKASFFELTTAMAMLHFTWNHCDVIVAEVGLGGRLDSTNVLNPTVSVITSIGLDHQHVLGDDLVSIAREKAGIIKSAVPVVCGVEQKEAQEVVHQQCQSRGTTCFQINKDFQCQERPKETWGSEVHFFGKREPLPTELHLDLAMEGSHQAKNAASAVAAFFLLKQELDALLLGPSFDGLSKSCTTEALTKAFARTQVPARLERIELKNGVTAIIDSSHNEDSILAMANSLRRRESNSPCVIVFGTSQDKAAEPMLKVLSEIPGHLILTQYQTNPRYQSTDQLLSVLPKRKQSSTSVIQDPIQACQVGLEKSKQNHANLVICGSFFLAAETRDWILAQQKR